ncbi:ribosome recycling factor family protein [Photobacterium alginatilyticum]|uniref:Ribosome recycling factor n=1 Tax=Photobacterium alginatilyticum TaxID=1775171 RepID=A0ABW9YKS1_9GAMM|nr:ribosome recycling factor family protein [Photobacterium alginatilyticum]NBI54116.1 ribosome recycling factor [Photobacterium alginatilyticum]
MKGQSEDVLITHLPSLIHRIGGENVKKAKRIALDYGCELKRIRRSRNWQLAGEQCALRKFSDGLSTSEPEAMQFLIRKIDERLVALNENSESREEQLKELVFKNPNITLAELMAMTNCSIAEARLARFTADLF